MTPQVEVCNLILRLVFFRFYILIFPLKSDFEWRSLFSSLGLISKGFIFIFRLEQLPISQRHVLFPSFGLKAIFFHFLVWRRSNFLILLLGTAQTVQCHKQRFGVSSSGDERRLQRDEISWYFSYQFEHFLAIFFQWVPQDLCYDTGVWQPIFILWLENTNSKLISLLKIIRQSA